jgi:NAD(P)-dependent dehydrogenase (short-subunit alcohol dehydrogenase family)
MTLKDKKTVILLGGTSGIGYAVAAALVAEGANVIVASSKQTKVTRALERLGSRAEGHTVDVRDEAELKVLFQQIGPFDHLVVTSGGSVLQSPISQISLADAKNFFEVRFWGSFSAIRHPHKLIRPAGSIVLTSGTVARRPPTGFSIGAGISAAIEALARSLAVELAPIRVNVVAPGIIQTEL